MKCLQIPIINNTYISSDFPSKNFYVANDLICETKFNKNTKIILLKFNLKALKSLCIDNICTVELCFHFSFLNTESIKIFTNSEDYNPETVTWCTAPSVSKKSLQRYDGKKSCENFIHFNVTSLVLDLLSSCQHNYGLQIVPYNNNSTLILSSSRDQLKPFLRVIYKRSSPKYYLDSDTEKLTTDYSLPTELHDTSCLETHFKKPSYIYEDDDTKIDTCKKNNLCTPLNVPPNAIIPLYKFDINKSTKFNLDHKNEEIIIRSPGEYVVIWVLNCYPKSTLNDPIIFLEDYKNKTLGKSGSTGCNSGEITGIATFNVDCTCTPYHIKLVNKSESAIEILTCINNSNTKCYFTGSLTILKLHC